MKKMMMKVWMGLMMVMMIEGHICILDPPQRSPLSISMPGDDTCFRRTPYCGGIAPQAPVVSYKAGSTQMITFQQNLNHWYDKKPGYIDLAISYDAISNPSNPFWSTLGGLGDIPAHDMVTQTNFSLKVAIPTKTCSHCVIRVRYVSHNPLEIYPKNNTEAIFYNCADITVTSSDDELQSEERKPQQQEMKQERKKSPPGKEFDCCAPPQFEATAVSSTPLGAVNYHIYYDQKIQNDTMGS